MTTAGVATHIATIRPIQPCPHPTAVPARPTVAAPDTPPLSPPRPATRRFAARRGAIVAAAARQFNALGLRGATLAGIAAEVGLSTPSLMYYYPTKEALATACYLQAVGTHLQHADAALHAGPGVAQRVAAFLKAQAALPAAAMAGQAPVLIEFVDLPSLHEGEGVPLLHSVAMARSLPPDTEPGTEPAALLQRLADDGAQDGRAAFQAYGVLFAAVRRLLAPDGVAPGSAAPGGAASAAAQTALDARTYLLLSQANALRHWLQRCEPDLHPRLAQRVCGLLLDGPGQPGSRCPADAGDGLLPRLRRRGQGAEPDSGDFDEAFLRAATVLVNTQGYRGASLDQIAARLQRSKTSVYQRHDTKLDLISACYDRTHDVVQQALLAAERAPGPVWPRLCAAIGALVRFQLSADGPLLRASAYNALPDAAALRRMRQQRRQQRDRLMHLLVDGMADGSLRPHDVALSARLLANATDVAASLPLWVPGIDAETAVSAFVAPVLTGLCGGQPG